MHPDCRRPRWRLQRSRQPSVRRRDPERLPGSSSHDQQPVNADTDQTRDLYACDFPPTEVAPIGLANPCPNKLTLISGAETGAEVENMVRASADGKTVYFIAKGVLASNTTPWETAEAGDNNLYVWRQDEAHPAGQTTFIGTLAENNLNGPFGMASDHAQRRRPGVHHPPRDWSQPTTTPHATSTAMTSNPVN